jgi:glutamate N-acetyltransferase/amino-acid N-acetyltransferase
MSGTAGSFASEAEHRAWLAAEARLPAGFRVGTSSLEFRPEEADKPGRMSLALIALERPTAAFAGLFTRNAFPGAPVIVGRRRLAEPEVGALVVNNKVANVCAPGGVEAAERVAAAAGTLLGMPGRMVIPSSTGVIGWRLPVVEMVAALPAAAARLQGSSALPAAEAIMTTDLYPKVRRAEVAGGTVVGIAKGAGMVEPNLATMLVFLLTDLDVGREELRAALEEAAEGSFQNISVDGDTSTSDTVLALSSRRVLCHDRAGFRRALARVCRTLAEDVVRNGEGVHHVVRVRVSGAPSRAAARALGKAVVNSPLFQCAVCGNDPNVGRLVAALGKEAGASGLPLDPARVRLRMGGLPIFGDGLFALDRSVEQRLVAHLVSAEMYASVPPPDGLTFRPPLRHPPHQRCVEVEVELGLGGEGCEVLGADRSHEYISENADYRS